MSLLIMPLLESCIVLNKQGLIKIVGPDAHSFLQGLTTIDLNKLTDTSVQYGGFCNNKGRVVVSFDIFRYQEAFCLLLPTANLANAMMHLRKYALFSKVEIQEVSTQFEILGVLKEEALVPFINLLPKKKGECIQYTWGVLSKLDDVGRFRVVIERACAQQPVHFNRSEDASLLKTWQRCHILTGVPDIYPETSGLFTPHMLNYDQLDAMSLTKGCYLGQEIVARTASLGRAKKHLQILQVRVNQAITRGATLNNEQSDEVGVILDGLHEGDRAHLLAVIQDEAMGQRFFYNHDLCETFF